MLKLAHELRSRGLTDTQVQEALQTSKATELQRARQVWEKRFGALPVNAQEKAKQMRFMQGRGFAPEIIRRVLRITADDPD